MNKIVLLLLVLAMIYVPAKASNIINAIQKNDLPKVQELLTADATLINIRQDAGYTPLHVAAQMGNEELVELLLKAGADVNKTAYFQLGMNRTPLHLAVEYKFLPVVKLLLQNKADMEAKLSDGQTALLFAASRGSFEICQSLLDAGADLQALDNQGNNVLHAATSAFHSDSKLLELLLAKGVKVNSVNYSGMTPLAIAIQRSADIAAAEQLIAAGADLQIRDESGANLLMIAVMNGRREFVPWLLEKGVDAHAKNYNGWTLLHYAIRGNQQQIVEMIIKEPIEINAQDNEGRTVLIWAAMVNNVKMLKLLIEQNADVNIVAEDGRNALQICCSRDFIEAAELLLANGAKVNNVDAQGKTALHIAVENYSEDVSLVTMLLKNGAKADVRDVQGDYALEIAEMYGHDKLVSLLKPLTPQEEDPM